MNRERPPFVFGMSALVALAVPLTARALPSGPHPRALLTAQTLAQIKSKATKPASAAAKVPAACAKIAQKESELVQAGIQGYNWAYSLGTCALAWQMTRDAAYGAVAVRLYRALLDDYVTMGDGAGGDGVVQHDTGYAMRFFGAYAAIAYDWLYDAPGVDEALRAHARARFRAWTDWYDHEGYLNHTPGSNYHAGYLFAKTLMAVGVSGEDGTTSDAYWNDVTERLFPIDIVQKGLGVGGVLVGGDWPEGWQYGPMSVSEYALAARVLEDYGVSFPEVRAWTDDLLTRFVHGMNPAQDGLYVAGDLDDNTNFDAPLSPRTLTAVLAGPSSGDVAARAEALRTTVASNEDLCPTFDALAEARGATRMDPHAGFGLAYLAKGTRNLYARTSWDKDAVFAVFTSAPRLVPDHQHADASNFVLYRGKDRLIVDPSPYGSRSSLTGNAITVDSKTVPDAYQPSQSPYAHADLPWARATASGVVAARADFAAAFGNDTEPSDVPFARRDWVLLPEGEVVTIDRVRTGDVARQTYVRFRSAATLFLDGGVASGTIGASRLVIHPVKISGGIPSVGKIPEDNCWTSSNYGVCKGARIAVDEYALAIPGPSASAVHVFDALDAKEPAAIVLSLDAADDTNVLGAVVDRGGKRSLVVASKNESSGASMTYGAPGDREARHVVFDAPEDGAGRSQVSAGVANGRCVVTLSAGGATAIVGRPLVFSVAAVSGGCTVHEDGSVPLGGGGGGGDAGSGSGSGDGGTSASAGASGGDPTGASGLGVNGGSGASGCAMRPGPSEGAGVLTVIWFWLASRRWRRRP